MSATHPPGKEKAAPGANRAAANKNQEHAKPTAAPTAGKRSFDPAALESLRARLPEYLQACGVELRKNGSRLVAKCPVHNDSEPSFAVFPNGKNCGCFPCDFQGDVFAVSEWMGRASTFPEAVQDVAATLGVNIPDSTAGTATRPATPPQWAPKPAVPFMLSDVDRAKIDAAKLAWTDAFHGGDEIIDRIAESLGFTRETLRYASWGECGLGISNGWLCYIYPQGLKWRNPDPNGNSRFVWLVGKALEPWRSERLRLPAVRTAYLCEGESDAMALIQAGLEDGDDTAVVSSPGTSFSPAWAPMFAGKRVVLCFDLDQPGQAASAKVAELLAPLAASVSIWEGVIQ